MNSAGQWLVILAEAVGFTLIILIVKAKNGKHRFWKWLFKETLPEPEDRDEWGNR